MNQFCRVVRPCAPPILREVEQCDVSHIESISSVHARAHKIRGEMAPPAGTSFLRPCSMLPPPSVQAMWQLGPNGSYLNKSRCVWAHIVASTIAARVGSCYSSAIFYSRHPTIVVAHGSNSIHAIHASCCRASFGTFKRHVVANVWDPFGCRKCAFWLSSCNASEDKRRDEKTRFKPQRRALQAIACHIEYDTATDL